MTNFETYRNGLVISDEAMAAIMRKSQNDVEAGRVYSMDEMEAFMNRKVYELTHRMDGHSLMHCS